MPQIHVLVDVPVGHTALAALTLPSQSPVLTLIVASSFAVNVNLLVPEAPTVVARSPPENVDRWQCRHRLLVLRRWYRG